MPPIPFDADAPEILHDFADILARRSQARLLAISREARRAFAERFERELSEWCELTGMSRERAEPVIETALFRFHRDLERRRDEAAARERQRHAQAVRKLLAWWEETAQNPANAGGPDRREGPLPAPEPI